MKHLKNVNLSALAFIAITIKVVAMPTTIVDAIAFCAISALVGYKAYMDSKQKEIIEKKTEEEIEKIKEEVKGRFDLLAAEMGKLKLGTTQKKPFKW